MYRIICSYVGRYGLAVVAVAVAVAATHQFGSLRELPTILLFAAVFVTAWLGGLGPGLLATFLSVLALDRYFLVVLGPLGSSRPAHFMSSLVFGLVATLTSYFTEARKRAEQELRRALEAERQAHQAAEAEIAKRQQLEEQLKAQTDDLLRADRSKDDFLATLAHELRNPLAPISNALHLLKVTGGNGPDFQWARDVIDRQVRQMVRLVDDLLDVSRIARGKLQLRKAPVQLAAIANSAVEVSRPLIEQRRHQLTVNLPSEPIWLDADATRLTQVVANLLNNAAKYTEDGGRITLTVERQAGEAALRVRDTGVGISAEMLPRVFERFVQVESSLHRAHGGLGIGLTLVRTLVEFHGGRVEAHSEGSGRGSEFVVRLPTMPAPPADRGTPIRMPRPGRTLRLMLVIGEASLAESLGSALQGAGHEVSMARDEESALEILPEFHPDLVFCDFHVAGINGRALTQRVRQLSGFEKVALVALTREGERRQAAEAGFDHQLTKPIDPQQLRAILAARGASFPVATITAR